MSRATFFACAAILAAAGPVRADQARLYITNAPATYQAGTPFTFELHLSGVTNLPSYMTELQFQAGTNPPNLTATAAAPPDVGLSGYPFEDTSNFQTSVEGFPFPAPLTLQISDATSGDLVDTSPGNDFLALITVTPGADLTVPIVMSITSGYAGGIRGEPGEAFQLPPSFTVNPESGGSPNPVPAPAAWVSFALGGLGFAALRKRFSRPSV